MTTVLIIVCVVFCIGIVLAMVGHLGAHVAVDRKWRRRIHRHHADRQNRRPEVSSH